MILIQIASKWLSTNLIFPMLLLIQDPFQVLLILSLPNIGTLGVGQQLVLIAVQLGVVDADLQSAPSDGSRRCCTDSTLQFTAVACSACGARLSHRIKCVMKAAKMSN